jgi:hypothetical protein
MSQNSKKNTRPQSIKTVGVGGQITENPTLQKAWSLIQKNDYAAAVSLLMSAGRDVPVRNALGVCLMRLGQVDQAVDVYRSFVLMSGSLIERPEISNACRRNFATALLMKGFPSGAVSVLAETRDREHPMAVRLYAAIKQWEKTLPFFRRWDWKLNGCEPSGCRISLEFEPGEFDFEVEQPRPVTPIKPRTASSKLAA